MGHVKVYQPPATPVLTSAYWGDIADGLAFVALMAAGVVATGYASLWERLV